MQPHDWIDFSFKLALPLIAIAWAAIFNRKQTFAMVLSKLPQIYDAVEEARRKQGYAAIGDPLAYGIKLVEKATGFKLSAAQRALIEQGFSGLNSAVKSVGGGSAVIATTAGVAPNGTLAGIPIVTSVGAPSGSSMAAPGVTRKP